MLTRGKFIFAGIFWESLCCQYCTKLSTLCYLRSPRVTGKKSPLFYYVGITQNLIFSAKTGYETACRRH